MGHKVYISFKVDRTINDAMADLSANSGGLLQLSGSFEMDINDPGVLEEPDDMVVVEPPCHPNELLKIPGDSLARIFCLVCGIPFAA